VAELQCGHGQHVRHKPPWTERPWVKTAEGRGGWIGSELDCPQCESEAASLERWPQDVWRNPSIVAWSQLLLESFRHWTHRDLIHREGTPVEQAGTLFFAPIVVVSHGLETDPILNYGNRTALDLWETGWATFVRIPSRLTAEPVNQANRERMLTRAAQYGFIEDYRGVRVSFTGRRFDVHDALVWNVIGPDGRRQGQAATFSRWTFLDTSASHSAIGI
jgi:hypothetical protein